MIEPTPALPDTFLIVGKLILALLRHCVIQIQKFIDATLAVTEKIDLAAILDYSIWDFLGDPGISGGNQPVSNKGRVDRVRSATASLSYKPLRSVTLQASVLREMRSSNTPGADYAVNTATATARLSF